MRNLIQLAGGVAVAGVVAAGSTAFTAGGGIAFDGTGTGQTTQFVGGTVTQTVSGATLDLVDYTWTDTTTKTILATVVLTFADATSGKTPTLATTGITASGGAHVWTCTPIHATTFISTCTHTQTFDTGRLATVDVTVS
jgi:hypothetical protein